MRKYKTVKNLNNTWSIKIFAGRYYKYCTTPEGKLLTFKTEEEAINYIRKQ